MKKILAYLFVGECPRNMSKHDKSNRDLKILLLGILAIIMTFLLFMPLHAESDPKWSKYKDESAWICPNKACRYDNYDGIRYCGLCGTERGSRSR